MKIKEQGQQSKIELSTTEATNSMWLLNTWNQRVQTGVSCMLRHEPDFKAGEEECLSWERD